MPKTVTINEAETNLSELLCRVEAGEEIVISRGDTPVAVLRDYRGEDLRRRRHAGMDSLAGKFAVAPDEVFFNHMTDAELAAWHEGPIEPGT